MNYTFSTQEPDIKQILLLNGSLHTRGNLPPGMPSQQPRRYACLHPMGAYAPRVPVPRTQARALATLNGQRQLPAEGNPPAVLVHQKTKVLLVETVWQGIPNLASAMKQKACGQTHLWHDWETNHGKWTLMNQESHGFLLNVRLRQFNSRGSVNSVNNFPTF